jgi:hypothetical protein
MFWRFKLIVRCSSTVAYQFQPVSAVRTGNFAALEVANSLPAQRVHPNKRIDRKKLFTKSTTTFLYTCHSFFGHRVRQLASRPALLCINEYVCLVTGLCKFFAICLVLDLLENECLLGLDTL